MAEGSPALSEHAREDARQPHHKREREGDGEEHVLLRVVGVDAAVVEHQQENTPLPSGIPLIRDKVSTA